MVAEHVHMSTDVLALLLLLPLLVEPYVTDSPIRRGMATVVRRVVQYCCSRSTCSAATAQQIQQNGGQGGPQKTHDGLWFIFCDAVQTCGSNTQMPSTC